MGANFAPASGFVNRTAIRMCDGSLDYISYISRFRDSFLRTLEIGTDNTFVTDLSNRLETRRNCSAIEASIEFDFHPNEIAAGYEAMLIDLPAGSVDIHVVEVDSVVAFGQGALIPDSRFIFQRTQLSIRLGHTLRF